MASFSQSVAAWVRDEAKENATLIFRTAASYMYEETIRNRTTGGGVMPHDTGNMGRSLHVQENYIAPVDVVENEYSDRSGEYEVTIMNVDYGDTLGFGFQAVYAPRQEYGFVGEDSLGRNYNQSGAYFVARAVEMWLDLVKKAEAEFGE